MPTCVSLLDGVTSESLPASLTAGALLGALHVAVRPLLRLFSAPLGCLTMGLIQPVLDVLLLRLSDSIVPGFAVAGIFPAVMAVVLVNSVCLIAAGRR